MAKEDLAWIVVVVILIVVAATLLAHANLGLHF